MRPTTLAADPQVGLRETIELIENIAGRKLEILHARQERGDVRNTGADTSRAQAELAFVATTGLEEGLAAEFEWIASLSALPARV